MTAKLDLPVEMDDYKQVFEFGAKKHGEFNFLTPDGNKCSELDILSSVVRHLAGATRSELDHESGLDHLLHAISRLQILYVRRKLGLVHSKDEVK